MDTEKITYKFEYWDGSVAYVTGLAQMNKQYIQDKGLIKLITPKKDEE